MQTKASESQRTILIVEDNPGDVSLIRHALRHHNVNCHIVVMKDGEQADGFLDEMESSQHGPLGLIVLDLNLPKKPGRELLQRVRLSSMLSRVPVVVFSSSEASTDREDALQLGATTYITKPSNLDDFLNVGQILKTLMGDL